MIHHVLFAHTCLRGKNIEVIEDVLPLYGLEAALRVPEPKTVRLVPQNIALPFAYENGVLTYTIDSFTIHQMVEIQY